MKISFILLITTFFCLSLCGQTADQFVNQGLSDLSVQDLSDANTNFDQALAVSTTNENANALYAITRLLVLPNQPAGSNFLSRLGIPTTGRDIYDWTAQVPEDTNGVPLAPVGVNANEFTAQMRTNLLNAIIGAVNNLNMITDTNFTISLSSGETSISAVTIDYGDLKLIQASLYGAEYLICVLNAQNLDAQLTAIRSLYASGSMSAQSMLANYPQLLTFSTTNDLRAAEAAFTNGVNAYLVASAFIRARPADEIRLFNYDQVTAASEAAFRSVLEDLESSLAGALTLNTDTNLTVNAATQFTGKTSWRGLLPRFQGNDILLGSFPDLTFGGLVGGLTRDQIERPLGRDLVMLPVGAPPTVESVNAIGITFTTLIEHNYVLESSTNFSQWQYVADFIATNVVSTITDLQSSASASCFYRLQDATRFLGFAGTIIDQDTGLPIAGAEVQSLFDGSTIFTDANGNFYLCTSLDDSWYEDTLEVSAAGYLSSSNYFYNNYGGSLISGLTINLSPEPPFQVDTFILTGATNGLAYSQQLSVNYGQPPYNWTILSGSLPPGINLTVNGIISGTSTNNGVFTFTIEVTDELSEMVTQTLALAVGHVYSNLHNFDVLSNETNTNTDGAEPTGSLTMSGNMLYGTTQSGGNGGSGTIFAININGTDFTNLYNFTSMAEGIPGTNSDGSDPICNLILVSNVLFGTTSEGGNESNGDVFRVNTDGSAFTNIHNFTVISNNNDTNADGANPMAGLVLLSNVLYGVASGGGSAGCGTLFSLNQDGTDFKTLHDFTGSNDGAFPAATLILGSNVLYGTTFEGGVANEGTVFRINTDGTAFTNLYSFSPLFFATNSDGSNPESKLLLSGVTLYGTAYTGGPNGQGTVFKLNTDGSQFVVLHAFGTDISETNFDGSDPQDSGLILAQDILYGVAEAGGVGGSGTVYMLSTNGTEFATIYSFTTLSNMQFPSTDSDGAFPYGELILSNNSLYGTAASGGEFGEGDIFSLLLSPSSSVPSVRSAP